MPSQHIWTERDEEGRKREVRAVKFGGKWKLQAKFVDEENWTYYEEPLLADLRALHDLLFRKYQRRRVPAEDVTAIERMLHEHPGE